MPQTDWFYRQTRSLWIDGRLQTEGRGERFGKSSFVSHTSNAWQGPRCDHRCSSARRPFAVMDSQSAVPSADCQRKHSLGAWADGQRSASGRVSFAVRGIRRVASHRE